MKLPEFTQNAMFLVGTVILYIVGGVILGSFVGVGLVMSWKIVSLAPPFVKFLAVIGGIVGILMWLWEVIT